MERNPKGTALSNARVHSSAFGKRDETIDSIMSKLITPKGKTSSGDNKTSLPTQNELQPMMRTGMQQAKDADNAFEVLPDLEMVAQIAISSILSSKDLITTTVNYDCVNIDVPFELRNSLITVAMKHFRDEYKLHSYLYDILYDVMFKTGSYPVAIIPESSVDALIKSGREGIAKESLHEKVAKLLKPVGILGSTETPTESSAIGLESLTKQSLPLTTATSVIKFHPEGNTTDFGSLHLTDNMDTLKVPRLKRVDVDNTLASTYNTNLAAAMERFKEAEPKHTDGLKPNGTVGTEIRDINSGGKGLPTAAGDMAEFDNTAYVDSPYSIRTIEELPNASAACTCSG